MSAGQESGSPIRENRTLLPAPLPPDEARGTLAAAAGVSTVGLRPPFDTPAAAFSSCLSRHSHLDCRARADGANSLRRALQKAAELAGAGHHVTSVRDPNARTIIEQHQIRRLLKRLGSPESRAVEWGGIWELRHDRPGHHADPALGRDQSSP